ncbi:MAG: type II secretion system F family protein [Candidatus Diapherotrites archaeon]
MLDWFAERIAGMLPKKPRESVASLLSFAGNSVEADIWLGKRILFSFLIALAAALVPLSLSPYFPAVYSFIPEELIPFISLLLFAAIFSLLLLLYYLRLFFASEARVQKVEEILPDFLFLVSSNLRAGMTPFAAFRSAARPEFGALSNEAKIAVSRSLGTESFTDALANLSARVNSKVLRETVSFFSQALHSGGHLAKLMEESANDLRKTQEMKKELQSSTKMYVLFVAFVVVIATPLLMAISIKFLEMIISIQVKSNVGAVTGSLGFLRAQMNIAPSFMQSIAFILLFGNSVLASLFMGVIDSGKAKLGLKFFPGMLVASIALFFAFRYLLAIVLGI